MYAPLPPEIFELLGLLLGPFRTNWQMQQFVLAVLANLNPTTSKALPHLSNVTMSLFCPAQAKCRYPLT